MNRELIELEPKSPVARYDTREWVKYAIREYPPGMPWEGIEE
jgi:hypothetical protein